MSDISSTSTTTTGMTGAGGGNMIRITGMATGLDVDAMVKKMLIAQQTKIDKAKQDQQMIQWRQEAYQDIIKDIKDLQSTYFNSLDSTNNLLSSNNYAAFDSSVTDSTVLSVTPGVGSQTGTYKVDFTGGHLAETASVTGSKNTSNDYKDASWNGKKIGFIVNGESVEAIEIGTNTGVDQTIEDINNKIQLSDKLKDKIKAVNFDGKIQFQVLGDNSIKIDSDSYNTTITDDIDNLKGGVINPSAYTTMADLGMILDDGTFKISYSGTADSKTISVKSTDSINDVINKISNETSGAVTASFSQLTGKFTIQTSSTGGTQSISLSQESDSGDVLTALGINYSEDNKPVGKGKDAIVKITPPGGTAVTVTKSTNNFTIDGVTYNLQNDKDSSGTELSTTFTITQNTQKVYDKISEFLDKYNAIVDKIQTKLTEKKSYDYKPLTDAQKAQMSDSQIATWEDKAKQGILKSDNNLQNLLSSMRSAFTTAVTNVGLNFGKYGSNSIGLDTSADIKQGGKINIVDEQKFKAAIAQHGDQIMKLFTNVSTSTDKEKQYNENGIFKRISDIITNNVGYIGSTLNTSILTKYANFQDDYSITGTSGTNTLPDQLYSQSLLIQRLNDELSTKQEQYYQQFSKLETAMEQLNSQQSWLYQQFSG